MGSLGFQHVTGSFVQSLLCVFSESQPQPRWKLRRGLWTVSWSDPASWLSVELWMWFNYFPQETRAVQLFQHGPKPDFINPTLPALIWFKAIPCILEAVCWKSGTSSCAARGWLQHTPCHTRLALSLSSTLVLHSKGVCSGMQTVPAHSARTGHVLNRRF